MARTSLLVFCLLACYSQALQWWKPKGAFFRGDGLYDNQRSCSNTTTTKDLLSDFLQDKSSGEFHIQGWRWHTMSLLREAERLHDLAMRTTDIASLSKAVKYVVGFNMKGLHKIEKNLFFPWVRSKMERHDQVGPAVQSLLNELEDNRQSIQELGAMLNQKLALGFASDEDRGRMMESIASLSSKVVEKTKTMLELEDSLLVPSIARLIPASEQKSFNNEVIRNLGIMDSRLHLVGMHEAVVNNKQELELFDKTIPGVARMMIPRWRRLLYEPQAGVMDNGMRS